METLKYENLRQRRILIFSLVYYPNMIGGAEVAVKEITDRIFTRKIIFDMITLGEGRQMTEEVVGNVNVFRIFKKIGTVQKMLFPFAAFYLATKLNSERPYDAVWSIMASYAGLSGVLFKKAHKDVPFILTVQEGDHFERREGLFGPMFRMIFKAADRIQAISAFLADWSKKMGAKCPITVIPNGVDYEAFSKPIDEATRHRLRSDDGFADSDKVILTTGRLVDKNAVDDIIKSLQYLDGSYKLAIYGAGENETELRDLAAELQVSERVFFMGFVPHSALPDCLKAADVFVRPSRTEGLGNSFLEAMAAGTPVVGTPVGGIPDFLTDGETGLLCEADNPRSIAQKIEKFVKDGESRGYIVRKAREMVAERYRWEGIAARMEAILEMRG
ncbi:MAG: glycosyltransferase [Minisyncoccia bacterium]|jgi:glycosyltransferase involved in cell wall biosynthesis